MNLRDLFLKHSPWMVSGSLVQTGIGFVANILLVRLLTPTNWGTYALILAYVSIVSTILNFRMEDVLLREAEEDLTSTRKNKFLTVALVESVLIAGLAGSVLIYLGLFWPFGIIFLSSTVAGLVVNAQRSIFERSFQYREISIFETGAHVSSHLGAVAGAVVGLGPVVLYLRDWIRVIGITVGLVWMKGLTPFRVRLPSAEDWRSIYTTARGLWVDGWLEQGFERLIVVFVGTFAGTATAGYFYQARQLAFTPHRILQPAAFRIPFNFFSRQQDDSKTQDTLFRLLGFEALLLVPTAALTVLVADPLVPLLFGSEWRPAIPLLQLMAGSMIGVTLFNTLKAYHMATSKMRRFIGFGRLPAFAILIISGAVLWTIQTIPAAPLLSAALSTAYLLGALMLLATFIPTFPQTPDRGIEGRIESA